MSEKTAKMEGARNPVRFLIIDDYPDDRTLLKRELNKAFPDSVMKEIIDPGGLAEALQAGDFDVVITDYHLRWDNGLEVLRKIKARYPGCPVIMLTGTGSEAIAVEAMKAGLDDYVIKKAEHFARVPASVLVALQRVREREERKQAEEALRESEEKYRALFENANEAIYVAQDERIVFANPKMEELYGYSTEELTSKPFINFIHEEDREMVLDHHKRRLKGEKPPATYPFRVLNKAGDTKWVELMVAPFSWDNRPAVLCFQTDITEKKRAEEEKEKMQAQLRQAQKMEAIGLLAGGVAHDFNNILTTIIGNAQLALSKAGKDDSLREEIED